MTTFTERTNPDREPWHATQDAIVTAADTADQAVAVALGAKTVTRGTVLTVTTPATKTIAVGEVYKLRRAITSTPEDNGTAYTYVSSVPAKATVNSEGEVKGVAAGATVVTATSVTTPTKSAAVTVTVV